MCRFVQCEMLFRRNVWEVEPKAARINHVPWLANEIIFFASHLKVVVKIFLLMFPNEIMPFEWSKWNENNIVRKNGAPTTATSTTNVTDEMKASNNDNNGTFLVIGTHFSRWIYWSFYFQCHILTEMYSPLLLSCSLFFCFHLLLFFYTQTVIFALPLVAFISVETNFILSLLLLYFASVSMCFFVPSAFSITQNIISAVMVNYHSFFFIRVSNVGAKEK